MYIAFLPMFAQIAFYLLKALPVLLDFQADEYSFASFTFPRVSIQSTLVTRSNAINNILCVGLASGTME